MKQVFVESKFNKASEEMLDVVNEILDDYAAEGYDLSLRQLYYQLVSRNIVPNTEKSYNNLGSLINKARLAGIVDWDMIKDRGRETIQNPHWANPRAFLKSVIPQYSSNLWDDQRYYVEVMVEKQALEGVLLPVCSELDVPFSANKGYSSASAMYDAFLRFRRAYRNGKRLAIVYLGDHDPSGMDMTRDVEDRLNIFMASVGGSGELEVDRAALNMDQVNDLNPPENPAKLTDSRSSVYVERFGLSSWELDAIEPRSLANLTRIAVMKFCDEDLLDAARARVQNEIDEMTKIADRHF